MDMRTPFFKRLSVPAPQASSGLGIPGLVLRVPRARCNEAVLYGYKAVTRLELQHFCTFGAPGVCLLLTANCDALQDSRFRVGKMAQVK